MNDFEFIKEVQEVLKKYEATMSVEEFAIAFQYLTSKLQIAFQKKMAQLRPMN